MVCLKQTVAHLIDQFFLEKPNILALAVSGGSDSLALVHLLVPWARAHQVTLWPIIMDHRLRPESTLEAEKVHLWMRDLGLQSTIIPWSFKVKPTSGLMEKARHARYRAFALACHQRGVKDMCTGHHNDDYLETLVMRKEKGSHWRGLAGLSDETFHWGVRILRPLLAFRKEQLKTFLRQVGQEWIEDPTNQQTTYARTRARIDIYSLSPKARTQWIKEAKILRLKRAHESLSLQKIYFLRAHMTHLVVSYPKPDTPTDQGCVLLASWIGFFHHSPPRDNGPLFWQRLRDGEHKSGVIGTWGGCIFVNHRSQELWIFREWASIDRAPLAYGLWDHRFLGFDLERAPEKRHGGIMRFAWQSLPLGWMEEEKRISFHPCAPGFPLFSCFSNEYF